MKKQTIMSKAITTKRIMMSATDTDVLVQAIVTAVIMEDCEFV